MTKRTRGQRLTETEKNEILCRLSVNSNQSQVARDMGVSRAVVNRLAKELKELKPELDKSIKEARLKSIIEYMAEDREESFVVIRKSRKLALERLEKTEPSLMQINTVYGTFVDKQLKLLVADNEQEKIEMQKEYNDNMLELSSLINVPINDINNKTMDDLIKEADNIADNIANNTTDNDKGNNEGG